MGHIWVKEGGRVVKSVPVTGDISIGRDGDCDITLGDRRASRRHAVIRAAGAGYEVEDLGSTNGTYVNGRRISGKKPAKTGDKVSIGETNLLLREEAYFDGTRVEETAAGSVRTLMLDDSLRSIVSPKAKDREESYRRLVALYELASATGAARTVGALFQLIVEAAEGVLESDRVYPVLVEKESLRPWRKSGSRRGALAEDLDRIPLSQSIIKSAAEDLKAVLMARRKGEKFRKQQSVLDLEISTALAVPLVVGRDLQAVLYADRVGGAQEFSDEDVEWLSAVARIAAGPLYALRKEEKLSSRVKSLEKMLAGEIEMVGDSAELREVKAITLQAAPSDSPVLVTGESGVGKELVARLLHLESGRREGPLEVLNCAALPESLAESELFGHEKGAFTGAVEDKPGRFELADGGTLFLDEIGEMPPGLQVKLLRSIETGELRRVGGTTTTVVDVRIVAATNRNLEEEVRAGRFREDLFYRLNVIRILVPPLRERREDIRQLVEHYLGYFAGTMGRIPPELTAEAATLFMDYPWPGNVRELKNVIERLMVLSPSDSINGEEVRGVLRISSGNAGPRVVPLAELEKQHILSVLEAAGGNKSKAAELLGINRTTLYAKLKEFGAEDEEDV
ncbi:MAG: sigma 54-interacting transcriptional regulator [Planctomycetes bacterium]|nr:sigma 54-interacting transcriptional regulator [Planctomycetota bacterium]